jgi:pyruvate dehydrogenase E1 component beta subunit
MNLEIKRALPILIQADVSPEWIDLCSVSPWDKKTIINSIKKTGRLIIIDTDHKSFGIGAEIVATVLEHSINYLKMPVQRISLPDALVPAGERIEKEYFPDYRDIVKASFRIMRLPQIRIKSQILNNQKYEAIF